MAGVPRLKADDAAPPTAEPIVHFSRSSGKVEVKLANLDSLFDRSALPSYPHTGPMVERSVATFLVDSVRERPPRPKVEVVLSFQCAPLRPEEEERARAQMSHFFANEAELAELDLRINRTEAVGSAWYSIPLVVLAGLVAGLLYTLGYSNPLSSPGSGLVLVLLYLVFITIVWVMLWDPVEKLLFDSYFLRRRIRALRRLAAARVAFVYHPAPGAAPA